MITTFQMSLTILKKPIYWYVNVSKNAKIAAFDAI